jgi:AraC-like DNA-binding protein
MIHVEYQSLRGIRPHAPPYEHWEIKSHQFGFTRLRCTHAGVGQLAAPEAPTDYLLLMALDELQNFRKRENHVDQYHGGIGRETISLLPGRQQATMVVDQPFDLMWFYKRKSAKYQAPELEVVYGHDDAVALNLLKCMQNALERPQKFASPFIHYIGEALDAHLRNTYGSAAQSVQHSQGRLSLWQANTARLMLTESVGRELTMKDIAARCGLSPSYFSTAFRNTTGKSPLNWLQEHRIERARHLLLKSNHSLLEIGQLCGFSDQAHFTRIFSRVTGMPPGKWRLLGRLRPPLPDYSRHDFASET